MHRLILRSRPGGANRGREKPDHRSWMPSPCCCSRSWRHSFRAGRYLGSMAPPAPDVRLEIPVPSAPVPGARVSARWPSPGLRGPAGNDRTTLWVRPLNAVDAQMLPDTDGAAQPFWSPDSRWVAFSPATN